MPVPEMPDFLARPKRFELLTPRFVVWSVAPAFETPSSSYWAGGSLKKKKVPIDRARPRLGFATYYIFPIGY